MDSSSQNSSKELAHRGKVTLLQVTGSDPLRAATDTMQPIRTHHRFRRLLPQQSAMMTWRHFCAKFIDDRYDSLREGLSCEVYGPDEVSYRLSVA